MLIERVSTDATALDTAVTVKGIVVSNYDINIDHSNTKYHYFIVNSNI